MKRLPTGEGHLLVDEVERNRDMAYPEPRRTLRVTRRVRPPRPLTTSRRRQGTDESLEVGEAQRDRGSVAAKERCQGFVTSHRANVTEVPSCMPAIPS